MTDDRAIVLTGIVAAFIVFALIAGFDIGRRDR
jgi:hypothetical protein